jgi:hypothetical protein
MCYKNGVGFKFYSVPELLIWLCNIEVALVTFLKFKSLFAVPVLDLSSTLCFDSVQTSEPRLNQN